MSCQYFRSLTILLVSSFVFFVDSFFFFFSFILRTHTNLKNRNALLIFVIFRFIFVLFVFCVDALQRSCSNTKTWLFSISSCDRFIVYCDSFLIAWYLESSILCSSCEKYDHTCIYYTLHDSRHFRMHRMHFNKIKPPSATNNDANRCNRQYTKPQETTYTTGNKTALVARKPHISYHLQSIHIQLQPTTTTNGRWMHSRAEQSNKHNIYIYMAGIHIQHIAHVLCRHSTRRRFRYRRSSFIVDGSNRNTAQSLSTAHEKQPD